MMPLRKVAHGLLVFLGIGLVFAGAIAGCGSGQAPAAYQRRPQDQRSCSSHSDSSEAGSPSGCDRNSYSERPRNYCRLGAGC